ncbi:hypothetical protein SAMN05216338_106320 [Bradyrhizobium sp. Rc2d]|nr:hypothetical protein SAMN05216338_106320 [Bradyrhizobium sp. Rc2d]
MNAPSSSPASPPCPSSRTRPSPPSAARATPATWRITPSGRWASNGVWFVTQILIYSSVWKAIETGSYGLIAAAGVVYVASTTAGSCWMMAKMLRSETGKQMVGAR